MSDEKHGLDFLFHGRTLTRGQMEFEDIPEFMYNIFQENQQRGYERNFFCNKNWFSFLCQATFLPLCTGIIVWFHLVQVSLAHVGQAAGIRNKLETMLPSFIKYILFRHSELAVLMNLLKKENFNVP